MTAENPKTPAEGFLSVEIHEITAKKVAGLGSGEWRKPIHGTAVLVAGDGKTPIAHVRTLGHLLPAKDRRYALRVRGVTFVRILPLISATKPIKSDLAPYDSMRAARNAGTTLVRQMIANAS